MPLLGEHSTTEPAEQLLRPYLDATLSLASYGSGSPAEFEPLFTLFYTEHPPISTPPSDALDAVPSIFPTSSYAEYLPEIADSAATNAEAAFWRVVKALKALGRQPGRSEEEGADGDESGEADVESMWPPLEYVEDNDEW